MVISLLKTLGRTITSPAVLVKRLCLLSGCVAGVYLWAWRLQFGGLLGYSVSVTSAISLAIAAGIALGFLWHPPFQIEERRRWLAAGGIHFGLAAWAWSLPGIITATGWAAQWWGPSLIESPAEIFALTFCAAAIGLGLPCFGIALLGTTLAECARTEAPPNSAEKNSTSPLFRQTPIVWQLLGLSGGFLLAGTVLGPWLGLYWASLVAAVLGGGAGLFCFWKSTALVESSETERPHQAITANPTAQHRRRLWQMRQVVTLGILAVAAANWFRITGQLFPVSAEILTIQWAALVFGLGLGIALGFWRIRRGTPASFLWIVTCALFAGWSVCLIALFPAIVESTLWMNSYISSPASLIAGRTGLTWLFFLPTGIAGGITVIATAAAVGGAQPGSTAVTLGILPSVIGFCCYRWLTLAVLGPALIVTILAGGLWLLIAMTLVPEGFTQIRGWPRRCLLAASLAMVAASPLWMNHYDPALTARVLFATNIFIAYRNNFELESLNQLDDSRLRETVEGEDETYTIWNRRGSQTQIRADGISKAILATDTEIHPQYSAEMLQGVFPLLLHGQPERVLMLGLGSSVPLSASLHFPISEVVCYEADATYLRLMRESVLSDAIRNPLDDERVEIRHADPALVALAGKDRFDVIMSEPGQSSQAEAAPYFTREFYQRLARQLEPGGIFSQRFYYGDYGIEPIRTIGRTLQDVFENVMFLQTAAGEMLLLATDDPAGFVRVGLLKRIQAPHVRAALADSGWDWSIILNLSTHGPEQIADLVAQRKATGNTISSGQFLCTLPREVIRWGQKQREIARALVPRTGRILDWMGEEASDPDLLARLSEVHGKQQLIRDYPDQYWAYRATVREQVTAGASNRSIIQQVKHQLAKQNFHPQDQRRMKYFEALGKAAASKTADDIRRVSQFATPYDPMLSYFLHEEVAEMYSRSGKERDYADELRHRLYTTYYSVPGDRSVRNVIDALSLLVQYPESTANPRQRWDHINGLLQILQSRWYARGSVQPKSFRVVVSDISETLTVADRTFKAMRRITAEAGIDAAVWEQRHRVLKRTLIKPLRDYRLTLLPQYEKAKATGRMIRGVAEKHTPPTHNPHPPPTTTKTGVQPAGYAE